MIRKKRMSKGIAKILSGLLVFGMVAGLVPAVPGGTVHAKAEGESEPGVTAVENPEHKHCVCGTGEHPNDGKSHNVVTWTGIENYEELKNITADGYYYLEKDVEIDNVWKCPNGVTLCLNGHNIIRKSVNPGQYLYDKAVIYTTGKFTLTNCKEEGSIKHVDKNYGVGIWINGDFNMYKGNISNNNGGVINYGIGTFCMFGGTISGNSTNCGGGVYIHQQGTFLMYGGLISGNTADYGGGVYNRNIFTMSGGTITDNESKAGGGVYNDPAFSSEIKMSNQAEISKNTATSKGGGVFVSSNDATTLSDAVKITENKVGNTANNLYLSSNTTLQAACLNGREAIVGVTTEEEPTENSPVMITSDDARPQGFRSDRDEYELEYSNGYVVMKKKKTCTVAVNIPKDNSVIKQQGSGELEQTVTKGSNIVPIVLEAATGYYFKDEDISKLNSASVKVTKLVDDGSRIQIECTPNYDTVLHLCASKKPDTTHTITATVEGENGTISPSGPVSVNKGDDKKFTITPSEGYVIASLKVDGTEVENPSNTYTFTNVTSNRTIVVSFKAKDVVPPVVEKPKIITQPQPASVKAGETATFTVEAAGEGLRYQWQIKAGKGGWDDITDANTSSYTTTAVVPNFNGFEYRCVVSNSAGSVNSDSATLTVDTTIPPTPEPNPEPKPEPTPNPEPAPNPTPDPAPATSTPAASTTTAPAAAAPAQVTYNILDGAGSSWTQNTDGSLAIRGSGEISKFREVKVDGVTVDPVNYTVTEGSTIITFKPEYLKSLPAGNHSFELVWTDGTAATNFTVAENADQSAKSPKTGEDFSMALCTALLMVSCAGLAGIFVRRKRAD